MPTDKLKWEHNALKEYLWDVDIQMWTSHLHFILTMQQNSALHPKTQQTPGKLTRAGTVQLSTAREFLPVSYKFVCRDAFVLKTYWGHETGIF